MRKTISLVLKQIETINILLEKVGVNTRLELNKSISYSLDLTDLELQKKGCLIQTIFYGTIPEIEGITESLKTVLYEIVRDMEK